MPLYINGDKYVSGDINATGYIRGKKSGVSAYLTDTATTTITSAGTYYPIEGVFSNDPFEDFTIAADQIMYMGKSGLHFEIDWIASYSSQDSDRTVAVGIRQNGVVLTDYLMGGYATIGARVYPLSGSAIVELNYGDTIQLDVTSTVDGDVVTFLKFITSIRRFFQ